MAIVCEDHVRRLAGILVLISIGLSWIVHTWLLAIAAFVGLNLIQSSITGICPAERLLPACDESDNDQHA